MTASCPQLHWLRYHFESWPRPLLYAALRLRSEIFVVEQNCVFLDLDDLDQGSEHLCGIDGEGRLLAYARLLPPALKYDEPSIGRVVVAMAARGTQLGRALMVEAITGCTARFPGHSIRIGAQQRLEKFYASLGFVTFTEPYLEDGIWHVDMRRAPGLQNP